MLNKIRQKFQSEDRKRLLENFLSLSVLQGANYVLPLITLFPSIPPSKITLTVLLAIPGEVNVFVPIGERT